MSSQQLLLTPLMRASAIGHLEAVKEHIKDGVDVNARGPRGSTALMFAAGAGHLDVVEFLIKSGARPELVEDGGWDAKHHALAENNFEIVSALNTCKGRVAVHKGALFCPVDLHSSYQSAYFM